MKKISIITAAYNCADTLAYTIESIKNQTYKNIEYIIIDGGSTDETVDVIKQYEDAVFLWVSEPDNGIYDAYNKGLNKATGDYVMFLGADDVLLNEKAVQLLVDNLSDNEDVLSAAVYFINSENGLEKVTTNTHARNREKFRGGMIPHQGMVVKTDLAKKYGFDTGLKISADYKMFLELYFDKNVEFKFIDEPIVYFSVDGTSSDDSRRNAENRSLEKLFHLPRHKRSRMDSVRKRVGKVLSIFGSHLYEDLYAKDVWTEHKCQWKKCRWCKKK